MDGLIRKGNDRRPRSRTACVACACGCGDQKGAAGNTAQEKAKSRSRPPAPQQQHRSVPPPIVPSSLRHQPQRLLLLLPPLSLSSLSAHERSGYPCPADGRRHREREKKDPSRAKANHHRPGKRIRKGASLAFASCAGYSCNKAAAGREKISVDSFTVLFSPPDFDSLSSPPHHHRPISASSSVARRRRPAGGTSQRRAAGRDPARKIRGQHPTGPRRAFFFNNSGGGGGGDGVVQGARAPRDAVPPGGRVARLGGSGALRGRPARLPPPRLEPRRRRRREAAAPRALRRRGGRLPRHVHRGAILHAPPHLRARGRGQPGAPQRPRARRHAAHVLPPRRTRAHLAEHQPLFTKLTVACLIVKVPAPDGGCVVPGIGDGVYSGVPALLLPLNNSPGTGGILPLPPGPAHWALRRLQRPRRAPPGELPRRPGQWHAYHPAGPVVLPDGLHALRVDAPRGVSPRC